MPEFQLTNFDDGSVRASFYEGTQITIGLTRLIDENDFSVEVDVRNAINDKQVFHESYPLQELGSDLLSVKNGARFFEPPALDTGSLPGGTANIAEAYDVALVHFLRRNYSSLEWLLRALPYDEDDWRETDRAPLPQVG